MRLLFKAKVSSILQLAESWVGDDDDDDDGDVETRQNDLLYISGLDFFLPFSRQVRTDFYFAKIHQICVDTSMGVGGGSAFNRSANTSDGLVF